MEHFTYPLKTDANAFNNGLKENQQCSRVKKYGFFNIVVNLTVVVMNLFDVMSYY